MIAGIITLISTLAPLVTNIILHFQHPDGTSTLVVLVGKAEADNAMNAANIAAFQAQLGTAIGSPTPVKPA